MAPRTTAIANVLLAVISILFSLLVIELGLRLLYPPLASDSGVFRRRSSQDDGISYTMIPNAVFTHAGVTCTTNSLGFRDRERPKEKPPHTVRIMGIGDSITFGMGVPQDQRFLNRLEDSLNRRRGGNSFEVMNLGMNGYSAADVFAVVKEYAPMFTPDVLLYTIVRNDIQDTSSTEQTIEPTTQPSTDSVLQRIWRDSYVLLFARPRLRTLLHKLGIRTGLSTFDAYERAYRDGSEQWVRLADHIDRIHALSTEIGAVLVIAIYSEYQGDALVLPGYVHQVQEHCPKRGIPCINLFEAGRGYERSVLQIHPLDGHPNGFFNELMAEYLLHALNDMQILPTSR